MERGPELDHHKLSVALTVYTRRAVAPLGPPIGDGAAHPHPTICAAILDDVILPGVPIDEVIRFTDIKADSIHEMAARGMIPQMPTDAKTPVKGFGSLTMYNPAHYFYPNALKRYALGTKNKTLKYNADGGRRDRVELWRIGRQARIPRLRRRRVMFSGTASDRVR